MIATIIIVLSALIWLAYESDWMRLKLPKGVQPESAPRASSIKEPQPVEQAPPSKLGRILSITLAVFLLAAFGFLSYMLFAPKQKPSFTEFYILGLEGKATDYPKVLALGDEGRLLAGIVNRENGSMSYRLVVAVNDKVSNEIAPIPLADGEKWERIVTFKPDAAGDNQKVEFLLYASGDTAPRSELRLWISVVQTN